MNNYFLGKQKGDVEMVDASTPKTDRQQDDVKSGKKAVSFNIHF